MAFLLDTDVLTILEARSQPAYDRLTSRLRQQAPADICTSIVNFQERVQGWQGFLHKARTAHQILLAYEGLQEILDDICALRILPFDQTAQTRFEELQGQRLHLGTLDLRIACVALVNGAVLISRNLRDFRRVPGLVVEDWTV